MRLGELVGGRGEGCVSQDRPEFGRQRIVPRLVEAELERLLLLVVASHHEILGHVGEAEQQVGRRVVELGRVDQAAVERRHDLAARQDCDGSAHLLE